MIIIGAREQWEIYPKHLDYYQILEPLSVIKDFFDTGSPQDQLKDLKEWRDYVVSDQGFDNGDGAGVLLFTYDQNLQLIEALYLLWKNNVTWRKKKDVTVEQIETEKREWSYYPANLTDDELIAPYSAIEHCFDKFCLQNFRNDLHEWLRYALYAHPIDPDVLIAGDILAIYECLKRLYSVAWLIHQREILSENPKVR